MSNDPVVSPPQLPATMPAALAQIRVPEGERCANCGAALQGQYCSSCGQRHEPHIQSFAHFTAEAFESITHADSRLWRTLWYLLARPGYLTREFFVGRRARYLPPLRLYLVISVGFFLLMGLPRGGDPNVDSPPSALRVASMDEVAKALETELAGTPGAAEVARAVRGQAAEEQAELEGKSGPEAADDAFARGMKENNPLAEFCKEFAKSDPTAGSNYANLHEFCSKAEVDRGRAFVEVVVRNIPRAMFVFLPLLALLMKLLYWRPKRCYVEHLVFLVHNHAFVFLALAIMSLLDLIPVVRDYLVLPEFALWLYMIWYVFRAMRAYYSQGRALTLAKYLTVGIAYLSTSLTVLMLTGIFAFLLL